MNHHDPNEYNSNEQYNTSQWDLTCSQCFKAISPDRPPVYNPENCCCTDLGGLTLGDRTLLPPSPYAQQPYDGGMNHTYYRTAQSYASSNLGSINCPEGPEREDPNGEEDVMNDTSCYTNGGIFHPLPLCPPLGHNEKRHRRLSSTSEMSYQLRRYIYTDTDTYTPFSFPPTPAPSQTQYLSQGLYIQSQKQGGEKQGCGSKRSYRSKSSGRGGSNGEDAAAGRGVDMMMCGMGAWDGDFESGEYALDMSGLSELVDGE